MNKHLISIIVLSLITTSMQSGQKRTADGEELLKPNKRLLIAISTNQALSDKNNTTETKLPAQIPKK